MAILKNTTLNDTGFLKLPIGTTGQRPTPAAGQMRFNSTTGKTEFYNGQIGEWIGTVDPGVVGTGGEIFDTEVYGTKYRVHVFTTTGNSTLTITRGGEVEYLIVAGGGGGGGRSGGGGGAGGVITGTTTLTSTSYTITVGSGGAGGGGTGVNGSNGSNSSAFNLTALGGGGGGSDGNNSGANGGSGGGGRYGDGGGSATQPGSSSGGLGNAGGSGTSGTWMGGGGGGAGDDGISGYDTEVGNGGIGISTFITGAVRLYAAGGGGGSHDPRPGSGLFGYGGLGGGGDGGRDPYSTSTDSGGTGADGFDGAPNTGSGGGAGSTDGSSGGGGGDGGSGIVIIRYPLSQDRSIAIDAPSEITDGLVWDIDFGKPSTYDGTNGGGLRSSNIVKDSRNNGITGFINNTTAKYAGSHRGSFTFNGSNSYIDFDDELIKTTGGWTVSSWVRTGSTVNSGGLLHNFIGADAITYNSWYWTVLNGNLALWNRSPGTWRYGDTTIQPNTTFQAVLVSDPSGTSYQFYYNGIAEGGNHTTYSWNPDYAGLKIGYIGRGDSPNGRYWLGEYYSLQVWDRALTAEEVLENYNASKWRFGL